MQILKKDSRIEEYDFNKIKVAVLKSAARVNYPISPHEWDQLKLTIECGLSKEKQPIPVLTIHNLVEQTLLKLIPSVGQQYMFYRNYKRDYVEMMEDTLKTADDLNYHTDRSNANTTAGLVSTKRSLVYTAFNKSLYKKVFLSQDELKAIQDGYIYIHDLGARMDTYNCFSRDTEFLTSEGIRSFKDYKDGDVIQVPDANGETQSATVHCYGKQRLNKVVLKRCSKGFQTVRVTSNHRWLLKNGAETNNLQVGDHLKLVPIIVKSLENMTQQEAFAWACGFILADGCDEHYNSKHKDHDYDYSFVRLCGKKVQYAQLFIKAGLNVTYPKSYHGDGYVYCRQFTKKSFNRKSFANYTMNELKYMAYGYMCADGHKTNGKKPSGLYRDVQCTGSNNEWLPDLLTVGGFYITSTQELTGMQTNYGTRKYTIKYQLHDNQGCRGYVVQSIEPDKEEEVWCLDVSNSHSFILKGGIPTGNCSLFDMGKVLQSGFEWEHIGYNEPKDVRTACNLISDITLNCAAQQYGKE